MSQKIRVLNKKNKEGIYQESPYLGATALIQKTLGIKGLKQNSNGLCSHGNGRWLPQGYMENKKLKKLSVYRMLRPSILMKDWEEGKSVVEKGTEIMGVTGALRELWCKVHLKV